MGVYNGVQFDNFKIEGGIAKKVDDKIDATIGSNGISFLSEDNIKNVRSSINADSGVSSSRPSLNVNRESFLQNSNFNNVLSFNENDKNNLRVSDSKIALYNISANKALVISNSESGGSEDVINSNNISLNAQLGVASGKSSKAFVSALLGVSKNKGDNFDNQSLGINVGGSNKVMASASFRKNFGKTSSRGIGYEFGFGVSPAGPELILAVSFVSNGHRREVNFGGMLTNILINNYAALAMNIYNAVVGQKINAPRFEVIQPDEKPRKSPEIKMFDENTAELTKEGVENLNQLARTILKNQNDGSDLKVSLGEYNDSGFVNSIKNIFASEKAKELSEERREIIKIHLMSKGVDPSIFINKEELKAGENRMKINDHNTNIKLSIDGQFKTETKQNFDSVRSSPLGEEKIKQIENMSEFKELTSGKSNLEKEMLANLIFSNKYLVGSNNVLQEIETMNMVKREIYDKGEELSDAMRELTNKEVQEKIYKNEDFTNYINNNNLSNTEKELLSNYIIGMNDIAQSNNNDNYKPSIVDCLNEYDKNIKGRGITLEKFDKFEEGFNKDLKNNDLYKEIIKDKSENEIKVLTGMIFDDYSTGHEKYKDMSQQEYINGFLHSMKEQVYDQGGLLEIGTTEYKNRRKSEIMKELNSNELYKGQKGEMSKDDIQLLKEMLISKGFSDNNFKVTNEIIADGLNQVNITKEIEQKEKETRHNEYNEYKATLESYNNNNNNSKKENNNLNENEFIPNIENLNKVKVDDIEKENMINNQYNGSMQSI